MTKLGMPKCKGRNKRNCSSCSNRNRTNKWKTKVVHRKHTPNSGTGPKLLSRPWILHNTPRIIKDNVITQLSIANGSTMSGHNIGFVSTSKLSILVVFNVPDLSYNLFSMGQLAELGYHIIDRKSTRLNSSHSSPSRMPSSA